MDAIPNIRMKQKMKEIIARLNESSGLSRQIRRIALSVRETRPEKPMPIELRAM